MSDDLRPVVRPTKRVLEDLRIDLPTADQQLHAIQHPVIVGAQRVPEVVLAQGAERIVSVADRVWFKSRAGTMRSAVTRLVEAEVFPGIREHSWIARWWIGAAGERAQDSPQRDFYSQLTTEVGRNSGSSMHLLPSDWDEKRLKLELGDMFVSGIRRAVRSAIVLSIRYGKPIRLMAADHYFQAHVPAESPDEVYLFLGAGGILNPKVLAVMLTSIPGVSQDDWQPEPSGEAHGADPRSGEMVWSTMLTEDALSFLRDHEVDPRYLQP